MPSSSAGSRSARRSPPNRRASRPPRGSTSALPRSFERFQTLNEAYNARFGFPFIVAVTGMTRADILAAFESRVENTPEDEFRTALDNVHRIARIRLDALARQA
nr:2-oxo-4-hydroxy-4-carboxy-5-ureidoimidazoline decarboxylase [Chenggangzhangella methanolivorans]